MFTRTYKRTSRSFCVVCVNMCNSNTHAHTHIHTQRTPMSCATTSKVSLDAARTRSLMASNALIWTFECSWWVWRWAQCSSAAMVSLKKGDMGEVPPVCTCVYRCECVYMCTYILECMNVYVSVCGVVHNVNIPTNQRLSAHKHTLTTHLHCLGARWPGVRWHSSLGTPRANHPLGTR